MTGSDEGDRRKRVIADRASDLERWSDPARLEAGWDARAALAADLVPAGARVLDIGCGAMTLERHLPFGAVYQPCDLVARDERTIVVDLNRDGVPEAALGACDLVVMLGVWEYLYEPGQVFAALARAGRPVICSYNPAGLTAHLDRQALGWVNDFSLEAFAGLAADHGYRPSVTRRIDSLQYLLKFERSGQEAVPTRRVHVLSYSGVGNFGDRLGFHLVNEVLPPGAELSWGPLRPPGPLPEAVDLLLIGIGNSLFGDLIGERLIDTASQARASIGIFGTQYREALPAARLGALIERLTHWYARSEEDALLYAGARSNVSHLGDWLVNAFPLAAGADDRVLHVGREIWQDLPLDRTIQRIQQHRRVFSERVHPLLCALTSAEEVGYIEQRESGDGRMVSGKFRSLLIDVFGQTFPEGRMWPVDRERIVAYKDRVRRNTEQLRSRLASLLG